MVASVAALLWALLPSWTGKQIKKLLLESAHKVHYEDPAKYPEPLRHLQARNDQRIEAGRLNMWEAVLRALHHMNPGGPRLFGMRISCDRTGLQVRLQYQGMPPPPDEILPELTRQHRPEGAVDLEFTVREDTGLPVGMSAFDPTTGNRLSDRHLYFRDGARKVRWYRIFTRALVGVKEEEDDRRRPGRLNITNLGQSPEDPDYLDPERQDPGDPDFRPWMKLKNGDSFALEAGRRSSRPLANGK